MGTDSFTYTLSDGTDTATATVTITVTAVNDPPVALDDTSSTDEDTAVDINVISNDTDVDGDTLSVTQVATPSNGTAAILAGSTTTVTYTPDTDFVGTDTFNYTVSDGTDTDTATATIIVGHPPTKPTGLTATASSSRITLAWDDPSDNSITGYEYLKAQMAKLTVSDGTASDLFGTSIAVEGDTMVVGARADFSTDGSAYVFIRESGAWSLAARLTASDGERNDEFAHSVAVDANTIVIGSNADDDNGTNSGSAYVFTKPNDGWVTTSTAAKITPSDGAAGDYFGASVAVDGDTIVIGASGGNFSNINAGSAYVFTKPATGWVTTSTAATAKLTASDGVGGDVFGRRIAVDGDTIVAGAQEAAGNGNRWKSGAAYVFTKPATRLGHHQHRRQTHPLRRSGVRLLRELGSRGRRHHSDWRRRALQQWP